MRTDRLTPLDWEDAADQFCCEDATWVRWSGRTYDIPAFVIVPDAKEPLVEIELAPNSIPYKLHVTLLRNRDIQLPDGRLSATVMANDDVVLGVGGGNGGMLLHITRAGSISRIDNVQKSVEQVLRIDDDKFAIVRRDGRRRNIVACFGRSGDTAWEELFSHDTASSTVLGLDEQGELIGVDSLGHIFTFSCSGDFKIVARASIGPSFALRAGTGTYLGRQKECLLPADDPTSVHRWSSGRIAFTLRHYVIVLDVDPDGQLEERWFGRPERCDPQVFESLATERRQQ